MTQLSLAPPVIDLLGVRAGDRNEITVELTTDGAPWDLTGAIVTAHARETKSDPLPALVATVTPIDEATGRYTLAWDGEDVRALLGDELTWTGVWDLEALEADQTLAQTVAEGKITCDLDVTRP